VFVGEHRAQAVLRVVHILILVDEDVAELVLIARADVDVALEQLDRLRDQVVEIEAVRLAQAAIVFAEHRSDALAEERRVLRLVFIRIEQRVLRFANLVERGAGRNLTLVVIEIV
jgi:hypothetical protein